jgi:Transferase family
VTSCSFDCDGNIADFNGNANWSVVGMHTQPQNNKTPPAFFPPLDAAKVLRGTPDGALMSARLTRLACGGCILGLTFSHIVIDGFSGGAFCGAWAAEHEALLAGKPEAKLPFEPVFDRAVFERAAAMPDDVPEEAHANASAAHQEMAALLKAVTPRALIGRGLKIARDVLWRKNATFTLRITGPQMQQARAAASQSTGTAVSPNDICIGVAWALLRTTRSRGIDGAPRLESTGPAVNFVLQTVDLRRFIHLPDGYFGNSSGVIRVTAPVGTRDPAAFAAASRASLEAFMNSTQVFDQMALMLQEGRKPSAEQVKAMLLPAFGDGMISSWLYPGLWRMHWGAGPMVWWEGCIYPLAPWGFNIQPGNPAAVPQGVAPDFILHGTCPASKRSLVLQEGQRIIDELCGLPADGPAAAPPAEESAPIL